MPRGRILVALTITILGLGLSGCHGSVSDERKAELLHDLRSRVVAYKPVADEALAPQISEPYVRVWSVQETVADALGRIGADAVPSLVKVLSDSDPQVRLQATRSLALIGAPARPAVAELTRLLDDPNEDVRRGAARALGQIGPGASPAVPALLRLLERPGAPPATSPASQPSS